MLNTKILNTDRNNNDKRQWRRRSGCVVGVAARAGAGAEGGCTSVCGGACMRSTT